MPTSWNTGLGRNPLSQQRRIQSPADVAADLADRGGFNRLSDAAPSYGPTQQEAPPAAAATAGWSPSLPAPTQTSLGGGIPPRIPQTPGTQKIYRPDIGASMTDAEYAAEQQKQGQGAVANQAGMSGWNKPLNSTADLFNQGGRT